MSTYNMGMVFGMSVGVFAGIILILVLLKVTKTDGKLRCEYDERQEVLRGRGFKYAFFTIMFCNMLYGFLEIGFEKMPVEAGTFMILSAFTGVAVYAAYGILNDCYFSLNENRRKVMIVFAVIGIGNLMLGIMNLLNGKGIENGVMNYRCINLFCGLLFVEIYIVLLIRYFRREETEE